MASSPDPNSSSSNAPGCDPYAQAVNDGQATVALASSFWSFAQPLTQAVTKTVSARQANMQERVRLKQSLGPWYEVLKDPGSGLLCKQPVLKTEAFCAYMEEKDGVFCPRPPCEVTEGWAVFLFALGIEPSTCVKSIERGKIINESVVSSVPTRTRSTDPKVTLQMSGEVFCHISNLFGLEDGWHKTPAWGTRTEFGDLVWMLLSPNQFEIEFHQANTDAVSKPRQPFGRLWSCMEENTIITMYLLAIRGPSGCSDSTFAWPEPRSPLNTRLAALRSHITRIESWHHRHFERSTERVVVLSDKWLEQASRVARRATTQGGEDSSLLEDCLENLNMVKGVDVESIHNTAQRIKGGFMFRNDKYIAAMYNVWEDELSSDLYWDIPSTTSRSPESLARDIIASTLDSYSTTEDPWKKQLFDMREDLKWLLSSEHTVYLNVDVINFIGPKTMPGSQMWNSTVLLHEHRGYSASTSSQVQSNMPLSLTSETMTDLTPVFWTTRRDRANREWSRALSWLPRSATCELCLTTLC